MTPQSAKQYKCRRCKELFTPTNNSKICLICKTRCSGCGISLTPINVDKSSLYNRKAYRCKECVSKVVRETRNPVNQKDYDLRRNYGITLDEYEKILELQNNSCAICKRPPSNLKLAVDHLHQKGEAKIKKERGQALIRKNVRGLLCWHCNNALGKFNDNPEHLERAASYLRNWPAKAIINDL